MKLTGRHKRNMELAAKLASQSSSPDYRHGALLLRGSNIIGLSTNKTVAKSGDKLTPRDIKKLVENGLDSISVNEEEMIGVDGPKIGDVLIGISSSGFHSNGFSLIRKVLEDYNVSLDEEIGGESLGTILLKPTNIYVQEILNLSKLLRISSIAHITGGGLIDNPPRAFNKNLTLKFDMTNYKLPPLFQWLKDKFNISLFELAKTFNCGIGFLIFVDKKDAQTIMDDINKIGYNSFLIGSMIENKSNKNVTFEGWGF